MLFEDMLIKFMHARSHAYLQHSLHRLVEPRIGTTTYNWQLYSRILHCIPQIRAATCSELESRHTPCPTEPRLETFSLIAISRNSKNIEAERPGSPAGATYVCFKLRDLTSSWVMKDQLCTSVIVVLRLLLAWRSKHGRPPDTLTGPHCGTLVEPR